MVTLVHGTWCNYVYLSAIEIYWWVYMLLALVNAALCVVVHVTHYIIRVHTHKVTHKQAFD